MPLLEVPTRDEIGAYMDARHRWADVQPLIALVHQQQEAIATLSASVAGLQREVAAMRAVSRPCGDAPALPASPVDSRPVAAPAAPAAPAVPAVPAPPVAAAAPSAAPTVASPSSATVPSTTSPPAGQPSAAPSSSAPAVTREQLVLTFRQYVQRFSMQQATELLARLAGVNALSLVPAERVREVHDGVLAAMAPA